MWPKRPFLLTIFISSPLRILPRHATIAFVSLFARSLVLIAAWLPFARATTITIMPATNVSQAASERDAWLAATFGTGTKPHRVEVDVDRLPSHGNSDVTKFQLLTSFYSLYFFMTGVDANVQIQTADGTKAHVHPADDDGLYFVGITSSAPSAPFNGAAAIIFD